MGEYVWILPTYPKLDEILACLLWRRYVGDANHYTSFSDVPDAGGRLQEKLKGEYPDATQICIGVGESRHQIHRGCRSAVDVFVRDVVSPEPVCAELEEMIAKHNRNGYLKKNKYALASMLRNLPLIGVDNAEIMARAIEFCQVYFLGQFDLSPVWQGPTMIQAWPDLVDNRPILPFSLAWYAAGLKAQGEGEGSIFQSISWWKSRQDNFEARFKSCLHTSPTLPYKSLRVHGKNKMAVLEIPEEGGLISSKAFTHWAVKEDEFALVVTRQANRHMAITPNHNAWGNKGFDGQAICYALNRLEAGRWYTTKVNGNDTILCGSEQFPNMMGTSLSLDEVVKIIQTYA